MIDARRLLFCLILVWTPFLLSAQLPKTLLWRISGNGLTQPSYLYGTMHLNDQRLFNFGDSVYRAIEKTAGLAIEVSPDELCAYIVNEMFDELENDKRLEDILDKKDYRQYSKALSKKFDKPASEITARDVVREKNKWVQDLMQNGEMPTFLDAYLYNIARRQGKWLGGIEDMSDQAGLMEDLVDRSDVLYLLAGDSAISHTNRSMFDTMVDLYVNQDLEGIEAISNGSSAKEKDMMLVHRNIKMARRIDSLTALRSMFLAIGAAHLPGDSGVIRLLEDRGFTLEPVFSSKKIAAKEYHFKEVQLPWVQVKDEQDLYSVEMPANPATIKHLGILEMKFLFDIFNMSGFCTMAVVNPGGTVSRDSVISMITREMFAGRQLKSTKVVNKDGVEGQEYIVKQDGSTLRLQAFATRNVIYFVMLAALKKESISSPDAEKFFKSFAINKKQPAVKASKIFTDSIMGVSLRTQAELSYNKQISASSDESFKMAGYAGTDAATGSYIMLISRETRAGYYIISDSLIFTQFVGNIKNQCDHVTTEERNIGGYKALLVAGKNKKQPGLYSKALTVIKNNRIIMLMVISDSTHLFNGSLDDYFQSFQFVDQPEAAWEYNSDPGKTYTVWTPSPLRLHMEGAKTYQIAYDTASATTFFVGVDTLGKYVWMENDSSFWEQMIGESVTGRLLQYNHSVQNGDIAGREAMLGTSKEGSILIRLRIIPNGNLVYKIFTASNRDYLATENVNKFFDSFRLQAKPAAPSYLVSKAKLLLQDLQDDDSASRAEAYIALSAATFTKADLPLLQEALFTRYKPTYYLLSGDQINFSLANKIAGLRDESVIAYIQEQYPLLKKEDAGIRAAALSVLAQLPSEKSYAAFTSLLLQSTPAVAPQYGFSRGLSGNLALSARFYPQWQALAKDSIYALTMASLAMDLLDSGYIKKELVMGAQHDFIATARKRLRSGDENAVYGCYTLLSLLGELNTKAGNELLTDFLSAKAHFLQLHAAELLLKNKQPLPAMAIQNMAADRGTRENLYSKLKLYKKESLFPKKYCTQPYFAESVIYDLANSEMEISSINFLKKKQAMYRGQLYNFYLYKIGYGEGDEASVYLGIAGAYDAGGNKVETLEPISEVYMEEEFDAERVEEMFESWRQNLHKEEEE